ncbi:MAG: hypothetical protein AAGB15_12950, partial [Pseudomonadota bacterium]
MADFRVTTLQDETEDNDTLSLREAVALANANPGRDQITFDASLNGGTIALTQGSIEISDDLDITGNRQITLAGDAATDENALTLAGADANIGGLTVTQSGIGGQGNLVFRNGALVENQAGAINLDGALKIINSQILDNTALGPDNATIAAGVTATSVRAFDSTFSGNDGTDTGAILGTQQVTVVGSLIADNTTLRPMYGVYTFGTGITSLGDATVVNSTIVRGSPGRLPYGFAVHT